MAIIRNKKTGETREVPDADLSKYGISAPSVLAQAPVQPQQQPSSSWGSKIGGGVPGGILDFFTGGIQKVPGAIQQSVQAQKETAPTSLGDALNPISAVKRFGSAMAPVAIPGVEAGFDVSAITGLPGLIKGGANLVKNMVKTGAEMITNPSKKMVANQTTRIVEKATEEAPKIKWESLVKNIEEKVYKKFGEVGEVKKSLKTLLFDKAPSEANKAIGAALEKGGKELLDWRRQIGSRVGSKNFLQKMMGSNIDDKVAGEVQRVISKELHDIIPETITPDKVYNIYSKFGDAPAWTKRVVATYLLNKLFGKQIMNIVSSAGN